MVVHSLGTTKNTTAVSCPVDNHQFDAKAHLWAKMGNCLHWTPKKIVHMWCDLRKPVTWWKIDILSYWYHVKVWIFLFPELFTWISSDTGIKSYKCSKAIKNKEKHRNYDVNFLYFAVSPFATCDGFSQIASQLSCSHGAPLNQVCSWTLVTSQSNQVWSEKNKMAHMHKQNKLHQMLL